MAPKRNTTEANSHITRQTRSQSQATQEQEDTLENEFAVHDEDEESICDENDEAVLNDVEVAVLAPCQLPSSFDTPRSGGDDWYTSTSSPEIDGGYTSTSSPEIDGGYTSTSSPEIDGGYTSTSSPEIDGGYISTSSPEIDGNTEISLIDILDEETDSDEPGLGANDIVGSPVSLSAGGFVRSHRGVGSSRNCALRSYRVVGHNSALSGSTSQSSRSNSTARPHIWDMTVDLTSPRRSAISPVIGEANHVAVTPPRTPTILDETVDLTDSPMAPPATAPPASTSASAAVSSPPSAASASDASSPMVTSSASDGSSPVVTSSDTNVGAPLIRCPVCLDDLPRIRFAQKSVMSTICGHVFCSSCLPVCIESTGRCPTCRRFLRKKDMHLIFI